VDCFCPALPFLGSVKLSFRTAANTGFAYSAFHQPRLRLGHHRSRGHAWAQMSHCSFSLALLPAQHDVAPRRGDGSSMGPARCDAEHFAFISVV